MDMGVTPDRIFIFNKAFSLKRVPVRRWADVLHSIEHTAGGRDSDGILFTPERSQPSSVTMPKWGFVTVAIISLELLP